ncbi:hypothetical protein N431DRAFT_482102 [Stipitochalara longipes BDJ]|nr:hypothetical protein N431DRAFT_482102 [Stipitochalara longipes BDJ]
MASGPPAANGQKSLLECAITRAAPLADSDAGGGLQFAQQSSIGSIFLNFFPQSPAQFTFNLVIQDYRDSSALTSLKPQKSRFFKRTKQPEQIEHIGAIADVKTFYEGPPLENSESSDSEQINWVEWRPPTLPEAKKLKWEGYAIQIYKAQETNHAVGNVANFKVSFVLLLSPYIKDQLKDVLEYYGVTWNSNKASINWPLEPLYFAREKIAELLKIAKEGEVRAHLEQLCKVINEELGPTIDQVEELEKDGQITYSLVWTLFPRGTIAVYNSKGAEWPIQAYRIQSTRRLYSQSRFEVNTEYVFFDGIRYRFIEATLYIPLFEGKKPITSLPFYPIDVATNSELLKEQLCARGRRALDFQGIEYMQYQDSDIREAEVPDDLTRNPIQNRVIIDCFAYNKQNRPFTGKLLPGYDTEEGEDGDCKGPTSSSLDPPKKGDSNSRRPGLDQQKESSLIVCQDDAYLLIMYPYVGGFSLSSKTWRSFDIDRIHPLKLTDEAYEHLHYKNHPRRSDDVIAGKGRGLLVLLSGPPGTGKTLMAEAIADKTQLPLYYVSANEMGTPALVNSMFDVVMANAVDWRAIILLDEADIYLQRRSENDLKRNKIVATLLRRLEYFQGIMFLTTNLYETIDVAVESRLHIHLHFPPLLFSSRIQIWSNFARLHRSSVPFGAISEEEIRELALWTLNGRDIKNALKMTVSWCQQKGSKVTFMAIEDVITATCPRATKEDVKVNGIDSGINWKVGNVLSHRHEMEELLEL